MVATSLHPSSMGHSLRVNFKVMGLLNLVWFHLCGLLLYNCVVTGFDFFGGTPFSDEPNVGSASRLYELDVGLEGVAGSIGCFGDFDSDK